MAYSLFTDEQIDTVLKDARKRVGLYEWIVHGCVDELARMVLQERLNTDAAIKDSNRYLKRIRELTIAASKTEKNQVDGTMQAAACYLQYKKEIGELKEETERAWSALAEICYGSMDNKPAKGILEVVRIDAKLEALKFVEGCLHHYEGPEVYSEVMQFIRSLEKSKKAIKEGQDGTGTVNAKPPGKSG